MWAWPVIGRLPPIDIGLWRAELRTVKHTLGLGLDVLNPRTLDLLDDADLQLAATLVEEMEDLGAPPDELDAILCVLIPKRDGGKRPIGLIVALVKAQALARRSVVRAWDSATKRSYAIGAASTPTCEVAHWPIGNMSSKMSWQRSANYTARLHCVMC